METNTDNGFGTVKAKKTFSVTFTPRQDNHGKGMYHEDIQDAASNKLYAAIAKAIEEADGHIIFDTITVDCTGDERR